MPVLTDSLASVPLGIWTDRYGGHIVFLCTIVPIRLISYATALLQLLVLGLFFGIARASFSVGTPYVARWLPKARQGFAMGIFGAGNSGAALNNFVAPVLMVAAGIWTIVPKVYSVEILLTVVGFWLVSVSDRSHRAAVAQSFSSQMAVLKDRRVLRYSQYYVVVLGGYVTLSLIRLVFRTGSRASLAAIRIAAARPVVRHAYRRLSL